MLPELVILPTLLTEEGYSRYRTSVNTTNIKTNYREIWNIYQTLDLLRKDVPEGDLTVDELEAYYHTQYPNRKNDEVEAARAQFNRIRSIDSDAAVVPAILKSIEERSDATKIALEAYDVSEGRRAWTDLQASIQAIFDKRPLVVDELEFVTSDLEALYQGTVAQGGLRWRLNSLNKRIGSLRKGNFGFVFARPETGKTTFLADQATHMAEQAKSAGLGPVLWFNNEEEGKVVGLRCFTAAFGERVGTMLRTPEERLYWTDQWNERIGQYLRIVDDASIHRSFVERVCKDLKPSLIIFDQIDKIAGFEADREDLKLGTIYQWGRSLAKTYCPVIGICQADGTGEGVRWLTMQHVSNAKTAKQAEADWILGIGKLNEAGYDNIRYFHLSKNKLPGDEDTNPQLRHDRWEVLLEPEIARYTDIHQ